MRHSGFLFTVLAIAFVTSHTYAQNCIDMSQLGNASVLQCANIDLGYDPNTGMFGWEFSECSQYNHPRHTLITTNTKDNLCPMINTLPPNGTQSIKLASDAYPANSFAKGEVLMMKYHVTEDNYMALFKYAAIMEAPQHEIVQYEGFEYFAQPWISIYIAEGTNIIDASYTQHALSTIETVQDWSIYNGGRVPVIYHDWTTIAYDLNNYIGKTINIIIEVYDCAEQDAWYEYDDWGNPYLQINTCDDHHLARVYCAIDCAKIEEEQDCVNRTTTLTIPEGFTSYEWFNEYGQSLGTTPSMTFPLPNYPQTESIYYCNLSSAPYNDLWYEMTIAITDDCAHECPVIGDLSIVSRVCDGMSMATLSAPVDEGIQSYNWYEQNNPFVSLGTGSMLTVNVPYEGASFCCDMTMKDDRCDKITKTIRVGACSGEAPVIETPETICADMDQMEIAVIYQNATAQSFDLIFGAQDKNNFKFENIMGGRIGNDGIIRVPVPHGTNKTEYVRPDIYTATLTVHPNVGNDTVVNFTFRVLYPSWVIRQQWNDVMAVLNKDYNGGYDIAKVRWFKGEGTEMAGRGAHNSYLYVGPYDKLETGVPYWAELTRNDDGRAICTCALLAQTLQDNAPKKVESIELTSPSKDFTPIHLKANIAGYYTIYTIEGATITQGYCVQNEAMDISLTHAGTYLIYFVGEDGTTETKKWIVK